MPIKVATLRLIFRIGLSLLFSMVVCLIPWAQLRGVPFEDLEVYLAKFMIGEMLITYADSDFSIFWYFSKEVLWDFLVRYSVNDLGFSVENTLLAVSAMTLFCFALVISSRVSWWAIVVLINPLVVDFSMSQVRMALAVSLLFLALAVRNRLVVGVLVFSALLVHSVSALFVLFYALLKYSPVVFEKIIGRSSLKFVAVIVGISTCVLIGPLREAVLDYFGDRRAEYSDVASSSVAYAMFWFLVLVAILVKPEKSFDCGFLQSQRNFCGGRLRSSGGGAFVPSSQWPVDSLSVVCLTVFVIGTAFGIPTIRFVSASFPLLAISLLQTKKVARIILLPVGVFYVAMQWWYWFS